MSEACFQQVRTGTGEKRTLGMGKVTILYTRGCTCHGVAAQDTLFIYTGNPEPVLFSTGSPCTTACVLRQGQIRDRKGRHSSKLFSPRKRFNRKKNPLQDQKVMTYNNNSQRKDIDQLSEMIAVEYAQGKSLGMLGRSYHCAKQTIKRVLREKEIPLRDEDSNRMHIDQKEALRIRSENRYILRKSGKKRCLYCKQIYDITFFEKHNSRIYRGKCKNCSKITREKMAVRMKKDPEWYCNHLVVQLRHRARKLNVPFDLDANHLFSLYESQNRKCFYTDKPLNFDLSTNVKKIPDVYFPSIDRLTPSLGYVNGNVVWCLWGINRMKSSLSKDEFLLFCKNICDKFMNSK